jgi:hypothetical protein
MNTFSPVYISNYFEDKKNDFKNKNNDSDNICSDLLDNMKYCLHKCRDNKKIYSINKEIMEDIEIKKCENINKFKRELEMVNIKIDLKKPVLNNNKQYSLEYLVNKRILTLDEHDMNFHKEL